MFFRVLRNEIRSVLRDRMYAFFVLYPVILGLVGVYLIPYLEDTLEPGNPAPQIVAMFLILITSYIFGAVTGFTLLDDKDDQVLLSLKITPISVRHYAIVKIIVGYIFGVIATIILALATDFLGDTALWKIILISLVASLQAPFLALIVNSFSTNKVEGFVIMKGTGLVLILPIVAFFWLDWKEFLLVIAPGFWPARMIQMELMPHNEYNLSFIMYFIIGVIYNLVLGYGLFKLYAKKSNI